MADGGDPATDADGTNTAIPPAANATGGSRGGEGVAPGVPSNAESAVPVDQATTEKTASAAPVPAIAASAPPTAPDAPSARQTITASATASCDSTVTKDDAAPISENPAPATSMESEVEPTAALAATAAVERHQSKAATAVEATAVRHAQPVHVNVSTAPASTPTPASLSTESTVAEAEASAADASRKSAKRPRPEEVDESASSPPTQQSQPKQAKTGIAGAGAIPASTQKTEKKKNAKHPKDAFKSSAANNGIPPTPMLARHLQSSDPKKVVGALNVLTRLSSDDRLNYALNDGGEAVVQGLVRVFDEAIGWKRGNEEFFATNARKGDVCGSESAENRMGNDEDYGDLEPSPLTWTNAVYRRCGTAIGSEARGAVMENDVVGETWAEFCTRRLSHPANTTYLPQGSRVHEVEHAILQVVILVVRNLSYVALNSRYLVHNVGIMRILTGSLYFRAFERSEDDDRGRTGGSNNFNICYHALQSLMNLAMAGHIDVTGRRVFVDMVLLDPDGATDLEDEVAPASSGASGGGSGTGRGIRGASAKAASARAKKAQQEAVAEVALVRSCVPKSGYGLAKSLGLGGISMAKRFDTRDDIMSRVPDETVRPITASHARAALGLFPALRYCLDATSNRAAISATLELMVLLVEHNPSVFHHIPDSVLNRLTDLLSVPRLGPDSFDYCDPVSNFVTRVAPLKLLGGYDQNVDSELRDRSVDLLVKLTALGPSLKRRVGRGRLGCSSSAMPSTAFSGKHGIDCRLYDALVAMLTARSGRHDSSQLASQLLSNLAVAPENRLGILYLEGRIVNAAGRDANIANGACNSIMNHIQS